MSEHAHNDEHLHDHHADEHLAQTEAAAPQEYVMDLAAVRAKLQSGGGKQYWRTLEELADDPHFEAMLHREFPRQASE